MMRRTCRTSSAAAALVLGLALAGCAAMQPVSGGGTTSPMPTGRASTPPAPAPHAPTPVGTTSSGGSIRANGGTPTIVDSLPSADARAVLATIPEPLATGERVAPPASSAPANSAPTSSAPAVTSAPDTSAVADSSAAADTGAVDVPIPEETQPLGDRPGTLQRQAVADSIQRAAPPPATAAPGSAPSTGTPPASASRPDTCWRVQVAAPDERAKADALRSAAESQLLVPMVIETEKGLFKIRTRDCLATETADSIKRRAVAAGFAGAFRFAGKKP